jgi:hypothetical protein
MAPDGRTLYVHHLISRSVAALDIAGLVAGNGLVGAWRSGMDLSPHPYGSQSMGYCGSEPDY